MICDPTVSIFTGRLRLAAWALVLGLAVVLAGCATRDPRLTAAIKTSRIVEVRVESAPDVEMGLPLLNGVTPQSQVAAVVRILQDIMSREMKGHPEGPVPARLVATLHRVDVSSTPGRILNGNHSAISGTVRLENARTGQLIAEAQIIGASDVTWKGDGLGMVAAMAINAAETPDQNAVATVLARNFTEKVWAWLARK